MNKLALVMLLLVLAGQPAPGTLILYEHSETEVLLGADSLTTRIAPPPYRKLTSVPHGCKIHRYGDTFWAFSGIFSDEVLASARRAGESASGSLDALATFDRLAKPEIDRILPMKLADPYAEEMGSATGPGPAIIYVIIADLQGVLVYRQYRLQADGSIATYTDIPSAGRTIGSVGFYLESSSPVKTGLTRLTSMFSTQFAHEESRAARGERPRVGGPASILRIAQGKAEWVDRFQGECPAIER